MELWLVNVRGQPASAHATISHGISIPALNLVPLRSDDGFASVSFFSLFSFIFFFFFSFGGLVLLFEDDSAFFLDSAHDADVSLLLTLAEDALL